MLVIFTVKFNKWYLNWWKWVQWNGSMFRILSIKVAEPMLQTERTCKTPTKLRTYEAKRRGNVLGHILYFVVLATFHFFYSWQPDVFLGLFGALPQALRTSRFSLSNLAPSTSGMVSVCTALYPQGRNRSLAVLDLVYFKDKKYLEIHEWTTASLW